MNTDCFAYNRNFKNNCSALLEAFCMADRPCSFYKTKKQHKEDLERYPIACPGDLHSTKFISKLVHAEGEDVW